MSARTAPCNEFTQEGKMRLSFHILSALVAFSTVVLSMPEIIRRTQIRQ